MTSSGQYYLSEMTTYELDLDVSRDLLDNCTNPGHPLYADNNGQWEHPPKRRDSKFGFIKGFEGCPDFDGTFRTARNDEEKRIANLYYQSISPNQLLSIPHDRFNPLFADEFDDDYHSNLNLYHAFNETYNKERTPIP